MSFITEFELELRSKLTHEADTEAVIRWASEKVLASYRNGITAGRKGATVIRAGKSRKSASAEWISSGLAQSALVERGLVEKTRRDVAQTAAQQSGARLAA